MFQTFLGTFDLASEPQTQGREMEQRFTSGQVVDLTGITPRQLQWWDERGIVVPVHEGHRRLYSPDDLAEIAVICELRRRGFSLQRVRKVMRFLQKEFGRRLVETVIAGSDYHLLTDGTHLFLETSPTQIIDILKNSRQPMLTVCISDTVRQVVPTVSRGLPSDARDQMGKSRKSSTTTRVGGANVKSSGLPINESTDSPAPARKASARVRTHSSAAYRRGTTHQPPDA